MSERVLRGSRLGAVSYESDKHTEFAPRVGVVFDCEHGHATTVPFAAEAELPASWECRVCGATALRRDGEQPESKPVKAARTHWDMLLERRSLAELEEVLAERLAALHAEQGKVKAQLKADAKARKKTA
jgi:rubredoxin